MALQLMRHQRMGQARFLDNPLVFFHNDDAVLLHQLDERLRGFGNHAIDFELLGVHQGLACPTVIAMSVSLLQLNSHQVTGELGPGGSKLHQANDALAERKFFERVP